MAVKRRRTSARHQDTLDRYREMRDFTRTDEPSGRAGSKSGGQSFVVQRHRARREHYDFRLEIDGVLKSWAVTRGPSAQPSTRRLAVRTEDHPIEYGGFEGVIPAKSYGAGPVMIWDRGQWSSDADPVDALGEGHFKFTLRGERMKGRWALVRLKDEGRRENWLLIKDRDTHAEQDDTLADRFDTSVTTGRDFEEILSNAKPVKDPPSAAELPKFIQPTLCTPSTRVPADDGDWTFEMKYDGYRLQIARHAGNVVLRTRNGHDWTNRFPAIAEAANQLSTQRYIIDGEAVVLNSDGISDFPALVRSLENDAGRIIFIAFDLLSANAKDWRPATLAERRRALAKVIGKSDSSSGIRLAPVHTGSGAALMERIAAAGGEGVIAKRATSTYTSRRSSSWLKIKALLREDVVIVGWTRSGRGRAFASIAAATRDGRKLVYAGRIGTGFDSGSADRLMKLLEPLALSRPPPDLEDIRDVPSNLQWVQPRLLAAVRFGGWTDDRRMRAAAFLGLREDIDLPSLPKRTAPKPSAADANKKPIVITHPQRILFPETGFTKADAAAYYDRVGSRMSAHLAHRPVSIIRAPDGIASETFFQRHPMPAMKRGVERVQIDQRREPYMVIDGEIGLRTAVQFGAIEFHGWGAVLPKDDEPDRMIFDLDPAEDVAFSEVREAAAIVRDVLASARLQSFPLVSGGKGLHVVVPLARAQSWDHVEAFASGLAKRLTVLDPARFIATASKSRRTGKIFIDWLRNKKSATAVLPYSLRARPANGVAVPIKWAQLARVQRADQYKPAQVAAQRNDPWPGFFDLKQSIPNGALSVLSRT